MELLSPSPLDTIIILSHCRKARENMSNNTSTENETSIGFLHRCRVGHAEGEGEGNRGTQKAERKRAKGERYNASGLVQFSPALDFSIRTHIALTMLANVQVRCRAVVRSLPITLDSDRRRCQRRFYLRAGAEY